MLVLVLVERLHFYSNFVFFVMINKLIPHKNESTAQYMNSGENRHCNFVKCENDSF